MKKKNIFPKNKPWRESPMRGELVCGDGAGLKITVCPDKNTAGDLKDIDVIHIEITNARGHKQEMWATPDEALGIAAMLSNSVMFWMNFKYQPYMKKFNVRRNRLTEKFAPKKRQKDGKVM